ncbi:MAG: isoaspartyl peptidase/L-asparaginase [Chlorobi bacterium]|nr:isoaspartyl peptidase/L-asparaginase [Chlorobiota bacterium]
MKSFFYVLIFSVSLVFTGCTHKDKPVSWAIVIHGGAGTILRGNMTPEKEQQYRQKLNEALDTGAAILEKGGNGLDAVEATIHVMENSPLFNAGKGAVFTHDGHNEMDAAVMSGSDLNAGAVAGVGDIKNPISAARAVMEKSEHVLLSGKGASEFARLQGLEMVDSSYFFTERRWKSLQRAINAEKHGTVGCVVLDSHGNLYAGTSTGGMTNKKFGRIGDSPIIGAGTYANNHTCALSATGHGEFFIRYTVTHDISALMEYRHLSLQKAAGEVVMKKLVNAGGAGGIIGVDKNGNVAMVFNTPGMYRGYRKAGGENHIAIYKDEK